jgi:VWFA-related protein
VTRRTHHPPCASLATALWLAAGLAAAQTVVEEVEVSVIELDVSVHDRQGRSVPGLGPQDFTVSLDGEPLEITNFRAVVDAVAEPTVPAAIGAARESGAPVPEPRHLVLYFDESGLDGGERAALTKRLTASLAGGLASGAEVMVTGRQGFALRVYQPFTDRVDLLAAALDAASRAAPPNPTRAALSEMLLEVERSLSAVDDQPRASARARSRVLAARASTFVAEAVQRVDRAADVFESLVVMLGGLPGRKAVLYVGDGLAVSPGEVIGGALREAFSRFELRSVSDSLDTTSVASLGSGKLADVAEHAATRQVAVYALDTTGVDAGAGQALGLGGTAEYRSMDAGRSGGAAPTDTWTPGVSSRRRSEVQNALQTVAETTGGRLLGERQGDVLATLVDDLGTYYSLGVQAPGGLPPTARLQVTARDRGLQVHHRRSARVRSADAIDADRTVARLLGAGPDDASDRHGAEPLRARAWVEEIGPAPGDDRSWIVPLTVAVPVAALKVEARDRRHEGRLSVFVATRDAEGRLSQVRKTVLPVVLANADLATAVGQQAEYRQELRLPPGPAQIAVAVRDDLDPDLTILTLDVQVGAIPVGAVPVGAVPVSTVPVGTVSGGTVSGGTVPGGAVQTGTDTASPRS